MSDKPTKRARQAPKAPHKVPPRDEAPPRSAGAAPMKDIAILHGPTEDRQGARLLRFKDGQVFAGEVRPAREGQAIEQHELVRLRPIHPELPVCEVEVLHTPKPIADSRTSADPRSSAGPARVSNERYRRNWNTVFKSSPARKTKTRSDWSVN